VGTTTVAWLLVTAGLLAAAGMEVPVLASNYPSPVPARVAVPLSIGGAALVTGLAAWEYWLLRKDYHLLRGPWRPSAIAHPPPVGDADAGRALSFDWPAVLVLVAALLGSAAILLTRAVLVPR
jgi:hypothetical protein